MTIVPDDPVSEQERRRRRGRDRWRLPRADFIPLASSPDNGIYRYRDRQLVQAIETANEDLSSLDTRLGEAGADLFRLRQMLFVSLLLLGGQEVARQRLTLRAPAPVQSVWPVGALVIGTLAILVPVVLWGLLRGAAPGTALLAPWLLLLVLLAVAVALYLLPRDSRLPRARGARHGWSSPMRPSDRGWSRWSRPSRRSVSTPIASGLDSATLLLLLLATGKP